VAEPLEIGKVYQVKLSPEQIDAINGACKTPLIDQLRHFHPEATATVTEPNGWEFWTNSVGRLMHEAADEIERLTAELQNTRSNAPKSRQEAPGRARQ
jgi:hypothetical protein